MTKRIIFAVVLVLFSAASIYIGLKPVSIFAVWQGKALTQEQKKEAEEQKRAEEEQKKAEAAQKKEAEAEEQKNKPVKGIHISLDAKSDQILKVWTSHQRVHGVVNILQEIDTSAAYPGISPLVGLTPYEKTLTRTSKLFELALGVLTFEKILLAVYLSAVLFLFIPIYAFISLFKIWKQKDMKALPRMAGASVLISLAVLFALPVSLKAAALTDEIVLSGSLEELISSIDENADNAVKIENTLRGVRRLGASVLEHIANIKNYSNEAVRNSINFLQIFLFSYFIIPVLVIFGLYKLTRYCSKLILKSR